MDIAKKLSAIDKVNRGLQVQPAPEKEM